MSRKAIPYNLDDLMDTILNVETENAPKNRSALYTLVAERLGFSPSFVMNKIKDNNIPLITPVGQRGRPKGSGKTDGTEKLTDAGTVVPKKVKLAKRGSMKRAIRNNCINCCGGILTDSGKLTGTPKEKQEVRYSLRNCHIVKCSLHPFRPLKTPEEKNARFSLAVIDSPPNSVSMIEVDEEIKALVPDTTAWDFNVK